MQKYKTEIRLRRDNDQPTKTATQLENTHGFEIPERGFLVETVCALHWVVNKTH